MKTYTKKVVETKPRLLIQHDEFADSPREWTNLGYFITQDSNYNSPDKHETMQQVIKETGEIATSQDEHIKMIQDSLNLNNDDDKVIAIYPIAKYEHSGIVYSLGEKHGWDYSNNGFYIITEKTQKDTGTLKKDFEKAIQQELDVYNKWCNGETYSFTLFNEQGDIEDSCCGFYDLDDIKDHLPDEWKDEEMNDYLV